MSLSVDIEKLAVGGELGRGGGELGQGALQEVRHERDVECGHSMACGTRAEEMGEALTGGAFAFE